MNRPVALIPSQSAGPHDRGADTGVMGQIGVVHLERRLGSDRLDVRLGAIDALERVMIDSASDHPAIVELAMS